MNSLWELQWRPFPPIPGLGYISFALPCLYTSPLLHLFSESCHDIFQLMSYFQEVGNSGLAGGVHYPSYQNFSSVDLNPQSTNSYMTIDAVQNAMYNIRSEKPIIFSAHVLNARHRHGTCSQRLQPLKTCSSVGVSIIPAELAYLKYLVCYGTQYSLSVSEYLNIAKHFMHAISVINNRHNSHHFMQTFTKAR